MNSLAECVQKQLEPRFTTLTERLIEERDRLASRLADVDNAIKALSSDPHIAEVVDAISRLGALRY